MLTVIVGHAIQRVDPNYPSNDLFKFIYSFHMPLLVFLSGMVLAETADHHLKPGWILKKAERLLVPFTMWIIIEYYMAGFRFTGLHFDDYKMSLPEFFLNTFLHPGGLWFLWVLFLCLMIFFWGHWMERNVSIYSWIPITFVSLLFLIVHAFGLSIVGKLFMFLVAGYFAKKIALRFHIMEVATFRQNIILLLSCIIFSVLYSHWPYSNGWPINLISNDFGNIWIANRINMILIETIAASSGIFIICVLGLYLKGNQYLSDALSSIGFISLEIYACHRLFLGLNFGIGGWPGITIVAIIAFSLGYALQNVLRRHWLTAWLLFGIRRKKEK